MAQGICLAGSAARRRRSPFTVHATLKESSRASRLESLTTCKLPTPALDTRCHSRHSPLQYQPFTVSCRLATSADVIHAACVIYCPEGLRCYHPGEAGTAPHPRWHVHAQPHLLSQGDVFFQERPRPMPPGSFTAPKGCTAATKGATDTSPQPSATSAHAAVSAYAHRSHNTQIRSLCRQCTVDACLWTDQGLRASL